jgi:TonB-linked SusC/RagA family outer membrane protein
MKTKVRNKMYFKDFSEFRKRLFPFLLIVIAQLIIVPSVFAQNGNQISVKGTVTDEKGESIVGVNVIIKNTLNGTITDVDGNYSIVVKATDTLQVSFVGYNVEIIPVKGKTKINVVLREDLTELDEVVVVGYGEVKRANLLGSISSITAAQLEDIPATNLSSLLEGRMAGVNVSPAQPTGNPGASTRITIRGETTFGTSGQGAKDPSPIYIVDGFEVSQEQYDALDPSEIESFSVLKDASAAVYGSKGANGVLLVKTKRGKEGKLRVNYSGSYGVGDATMQTEMLSAYDQARMINSRYKDDPLFTGFISAEELEAMKNQNHDWLNQAWQKSAVTRHTLNFSGGSEKVKYFAGGTYLYTEGNFPQMDVGKYSYRLGLDAKITDDLSVSATIALDNRDFKRPYLTGTGANTMEDLFQNLLQVPKWTPPYIDGKPVYNNVSFNPFALFESDSYRRDVDKGNTVNLKVTYEFPKIKGLVASASYSRRESHSYNKEYNIPYTLYEYQPLFQYILSDQIASIQEISNKNRISESFGSNQNYQLNFSLNYSKKIGKHSFASFVTYEQSEGNSYGFSALAEGIQIYGIETQRAFNYLAAKSDGSMSEGGDLGAVGRLNYSYADKYLLESTVRVESTTKFAPGERVGVFPAVSVGWVMSEENFMKEKLAFIDFLKIRFSMGLTGYSSVGDYEYNLNFGSSGSYLFGGSTAVGGMGISGKTDVVSTGVSWEKSRMHNLGIDLKFLENKLSVSTDMYYTYQFDILDKRTSQFPQTSGITDMPSENIGRLEAWGYDMSIGYHGKIGRDFRWNANAIFSFSTNRIIDRPTQYAPNDFRYPIGQSTSAAGREEGYITNGIIRTQDQLDAINADWMTKWGHNYIVDGKPAEVGSLFFQDIGRPGNRALGEPETVFEPDGLINSVFDKTYVERINDHFVWKNLLPTNISLSANWKNFSISTLFGMSYGITNKVVDKLARTVPTTTKNSPAFWSDYWTPENTNAAYPSPKFASTDEWVSTFWMKDVYQVRMRNLNISYNMPGNLSKKLGIPELRIYFVGTNLWSPVTTFKYKEDAIARYNTYPLLKTFSFGINLKM